MRKLVAVILAIIMVVGIGSVTFGAGSYKPYYGGGSVVTTRTSRGTATTTVASTGVSGNWTAAENDWYFENYKGQWGLIQNPYAAGGTKSQWFFFDANGKMLTGWVWIKGADGITRCYYLNPNHDGSFGACYLNGTTPDGYTVDASGAWTVNGVVQTK